MRFLSSLPSSITNPALDPKLGNIVVQNSDASLQAFLVSGVNIVFGAGGIITFFMLLIGAVEYITSGGDKEAVEKARKKITSALIGLALLFSTYAIVRIVGDLFGINLLNFSIQTIPNS
jgi:hypothetical protein